MSAVVHVIAAGEVSKAPFYAAGGAFAAWAVILAAIGLARPGFPGSALASRAAMGLSVLLTAAVMFTAVATASKPSKGEGREQPPSKQGEPAAAPPGKRLGGTSGGGGPPATPKQTGQAPPAAGGAPSGGTARAGGAAAGGTTTLQVAADPSGQLAFVQKSLTAQAGKVTINFANRSQTPHDVTIEQAGRRIGGTSQITGSTTTATVSLKPGKYTFYCSVDAHRQAGMQGPLTVR